MLSPIVTLSLYYGQDSGRTLDSMDHLGLGKFGMAQDQAALKI